MISAEAEVQVGIPECRDLSEIHKRPSAMYRCGPNHLQEVKITIIDDPFIVETHAPNS